MCMVRFGVVREVVGDRDTSQETRLRAALTRCFGAGVTLAVADSYAALLRSFTRGDLEAAWLTPAMVVEASRRTRLALVAGSMRDGSSDYFAALVVRDREGVRTLADLQGRRAGWVDPWSAAGYLYPRRMLRDAGLDPTNVFVKQKFFGSHRAVLAALGDGEIDVGATYLHRDGRLRQLARDNVTAIGALGRSAAIPSDALCLSDGIAAGDVAMVRRQLAGPASTELAAMLQAEGFVERPLGDYAMVRALLDDEWGRTSSEPPGA